MSVTEIKDQLTRLTNAERWELLNWMFENFDDDGSPLAAPDPRRGIARTTLSS